MHSQSHVQIVRLFTETAVVTDRNQARLESSASSQGGPICSKVVHYAQKWSTMNKSGQSHLNVAHGPSCLKLAHHQEIAH